MTLPHLNTLEKLRGTNSGDQVRFIFETSKAVRNDRKLLHFQKQLRDQIS